MSDTETKDKTEGKRGNKIEDYLTGPRKKSRNYVIFGLSDGFDRDLARNLVHTTQRHYPSLSIVVPRNMEELAKHFTRTISLLVLDDQFDQPENVMKMVKILKETRRKDAIPVLFLTRNASTLIERYHEELRLYHELDEYVVYPGLPTNKIMSRIRSGIDEKNRRRSRRYQTTIDMKFFHLAKDQWLDGRIVDMSLHGATIEAKDQMIFRKGDQLKIVIQVGDFLNHLQGEFLKLSARARRVMISGTQVAVSFEYVTETKFSQLSQYLSNYVQRQMLRQAIKTKNKLASQQNQG
ncbi:MAG: PilZ domain-containing protein [Oligoflexus sp.]